MEVINQVLKVNEEETSEKTEEIVNEKVEDTIKTETENINENTEAETETETSNCLALTVKEEYRVVVFKNIIKKGLRITWKIAISIITMNFLNTFL